MTDHNYGLNMDHATRGTIVVLTVLTLTATPYYAAAERPSRCPHRTHPTHQAAATGDASTREQRARASQCGPAQREMSHEIRNGECNHSESFARWVFWCAGVAYQ